jgi:hypothetical protein
MRPAPSNAADRAPAPWHGIRGSPSTTLAILEFLMARGDSISIRRVAMIFKSRAWTHIRIEDGYPSIAVEFRP